MNAKIISDSPQLYHWQISVPIFKQPIILRQLGIAVGIPFALITIIIGVSSGKSIYTLYALALIALLLFLTWLFILIVYKGKYEVEFILDDRGAFCRTQSQQRKKIRLINFLLSILGLASGQASVAGAGVLAQSKEETFLSWQQIQKVKYKYLSQTIMLRGNITENMAIFCPENHYQEIESFLKKRIKCQ